MSTPSPHPLPLPPGITQSYLPTPSLTYHILSAGLPSNPLILLLHGFPELAFSWRKIMAPLSQDGYHVVALDQRGYGFITGWDTRSYSQVDLSTFSFTRLVRDVIILVHALGYKEVACLVGHDFGGLGAGMCSLVREDVFKSVVIMSHPFKCPPPFLPSSSPPSPTSSSPSTEERKPDIHQALASLSPPRKHYKYYYSTRPAASEMLNPILSLQPFLRGYSHLKSASSPLNNPEPLKSWSASDLVKLTTYYTMPLHSTMRETVTEAMKGKDNRASCGWLSDEDLGVHTETWAKTGFQGGLNWYRIATDQSGKYTEDLEVYAEKKIEIPCLYVAGEKDWGSYQEPEALDNMGNVYTNFKGVVMVGGAGHWVQQEQPEKVVNILANFLRELKRERIGF